MIHWILPVVIPQNQSIAQHCMTEHTSILQMELRNNAVYI